METMKSLRRKHKNRFTFMDYIKLKKDVHIRVRKKVAGYIPFREWLRSFDIMLCTNKAKRIYEGPH